MGNAVKPRAQRIYGEASSDDGVRVLVDRVLPRGITTERAHIDEWCRALS